MSVHIVDVEEALVPIAVRVNVAFLQLLFADQNIFRENATRYEGDR
jgi:hypothetical protein